MPEVFGPVRDPPRGGACAKSPVGLVHTAHVVSWQDSLPPFDERVLVDSTSVFRPDFQPGHHGLPKFFLAELLIVIAVQGFEKTQVAAGKHAAGSLRCLLLLRYQPAIALSKEFRAAQSGLVVIAQRLLPIPHQ